ncbi:hypothetical protein [Flavobacterium sp.]|uniref:hypothetical protein n=1 Tax=Flavobacterium sp. TaxID=239 RepID=UPI0025E95EDE|nr:hypothetical protein [Flavobacterium sp.]
MKIYDSFGTFDSTKLEFDLAVQLTNIDTDIYEIKAYYDICNTSRYALLAILQTKDGNDKDLSSSLANCACMVTEMKFLDLNRSYVNENDKDIFKVSKEDVINVVVHHGIGFNPTTNPDDDLYIKNYKAQTYVYYPDGAKPGRGGRGILR